MLSAAVTRMCEHSLGDDVQRECSAGTAHTTLEYASRMIIAKIDCVRVCVLLAECASSEYSASRFS